MYFKALCPRSRASFLSHLLSVRWQYTLFARTYLLRHLEHTARNMTGTLPQYVEIWNHMVEIAWVLRNPTPGTMLEDLIKYGEEAVMLAKETTSSGRIWPNMEEIYLPDTSKPTLLQRWCLRPGTPFFTWIMLVRMINGDEKVILSVWMAVIVVMRAMEAKYRHIEPQDLEGIFQEQKLLQGQVNLCEYDKFLPIVQHIKQGHCFRKDTRIHSENVPVQDGCWQWNRVDVWLRDFYGQLVWCLDMRPPVAAGVLSRNGRARNNLHFVHPYPRDAALIHTDNTFFDSEWVNKFDEGWHGNS